MNCGQCGDAGAAEAAGRRRFGTVVGRTARRLAIRLIGAV
jgi:hypothetical protein